MSGFKIQQRITNRNNDSIKQYFKDIDAYPMFTPQEEAECAFKAVNGDEKALEELVKRNLRFVVTVAKKYETKDAPLGDLINEGNMGLIEAAKRFKPDQGFKFISFAVWWVSKYIKEYLTNKSRTVRIPTNKVNSLASLNQKISSLEQKVCREVDIEDVIMEYGDEVTDDLSNINLLNVFGIDSMDREVNKFEGEGVSISDLMSDETNNETDYLLYQDDMSIQVKRILQTLSVKEQIIITEFFGLDGHKPKTLEEIGESLGVTREAIRVAKERVFIKLRKKGGLKEFIV
jgi:RNA polymerase primary sigma factor